MAGVRALWLPSVLRAAGLDVYELPGWEKRGKGMAAILGVVAHHTATSIKWKDGHVAALLRDGRRDLAGPLSQLGLERDGTFVVIASGRANHNGYGKWGNDSLGIEAYNDGVGEPWSDAMVDAYGRGAGAILKHLHLDPAQHLLGHRETDPKRKIDPANLSMHTLRTIASGEDDMPLTPAERQWFNDQEEKRDQQYAHLLEIIGEIRRNVRQDIVLDGGTPKN